ncbi:glycosyltransferase family 4 protein [Candidatus Woesearchaeota archaeon]|nr:glycosyltransferase family 4 protein [Candidatus Woesearchaeota archaeon]
MKIAILTPTFYHFSGIDRVAEQQAKDYARKGNEVSVFTLDATIKPEGFKLEVLGMSKNLFLQRLYRLLFFLDTKKTKSATKKLKDFDMVISHFYPMNWIAYQAKKKYNVKYVYYNHGIGYSELFANPFEKLYLRLFSFFNNLSLKNADSAISISKFMQSELKKETGLDSKVIYDEVDKTRFRKNLNGNKIRKKLGIKSNEKLLLFIGRISPHKNIHTLLEIFNIINQKLPNAKLLIIGKSSFPSYYKKLRNMANSNVIFMDFVDDKELPYYYAACDLYVTASLWEGFNLPAAEAQACGKKVIAFNICSHPEIVKNGVLVKNVNTRDFVNVVIKILTQK